MPPKSAIVPPDIVTSSLILCRGGNITNKKSKKGKPKRIPKDIKCINILVIKMEAVSVTLMVVRFCKTQKQEMLLWYFLRPLPNKAFLSQVGEEE